MGGVAPPGPATSSRAPKCCIAAEFLSSHELVKTERGHLEPKPLPSPNVPDKPHSSLFVKPPSALTSLPRLLEQAVNASQPEALPLLQPPTPRKPGPV